MSYDPKKGYFLCFVGPAGAGKSTLTEFLLASHPAELSLAISATSRAPRPGEADGKHYFFLSREDFLQQVEDGEFFEWEETHGNLYGTPKRWVDDVTERGKRVLLDIDIRGAYTFRDAFPDHFCGVLVLPPSVKELKERVLGRGGVKEEELLTRLETTKRELLDFCTGVENGTIQHVIINQEKGKAEQSAEEIFLGSASVLTPELQKETITRLQQFHAEITQGESS